MSGIIEVANSLEEAEELALAHFGSPRHNLSTSSRGEAVKRPDYNPPELALSDRAHQKTLSSAIALSPHCNLWKAIAHIERHYPA